VTRTQTTSADVLIDNLVAVHGNLAREVGNMDPEDPLRRSGCRDWDVSQVLGHLGGATELGLRLLEATIAGYAPEIDRDTIWARWDKSPLSMLLRRISNTRREKAPPWPRCPRSTDSKLPR